MFFDKKIMYVISTSYPVSIPKYRPIVKHILLYFIGSFSRKISQCTWPSLWAFHFCFWWLWRDYPLRLIHSVRVCLATTMCQALCAGHNGWKKMPWCLNLFHLEMGNSYFEAYREDKIEMDVEEMGWNSILESYLFHMHTSERNIYA